MIDIFFFIICIVVSALYPLGIEPLYYAPIVTALVVLLDSLFYAIIPLIIFRIFTKVKQRKFLFLWRISLIIFYGIEIYVFHWQSFVSDTLKLENIIFLENLLIISPLLLKIFLLWTTHYLSEKRFFAGRVSYISFVSFQTKFFAGFLLIPYLILRTIEDVISNVGFLQRLFSIYSFLNVLWVIVIVFLMFLLAPFWLRFVLRAKPLKNSSLRNSLETYSKEVGFKFRDILVFKTPSSIANAFIVGLYAPIRYVFLTSELLKSLTEEQTKAVFAHEVGHAMHNHLMLYFFLTISVLLFTIFVGIVGEIFLPEIFAFLLSIFVFISLFAYLFIYISRNFERQADVYAVLTTPPSTFQESLIKIGEVNGIPIEEKSLRHKSIKERIDFVNTLFVDSGSSLKKFIKTMQNIVIQISIFVTLSIILAAIVVIYDFCKSPTPTERWEHAQGIYNLKRDAYNLMKKKKLMESKIICDEILKREKNEKYTLLLRAQIYLDLNDKENALNDILRIEKSGGFKELKLRLALEELKQICRN